MSEILHKGWLTTREGEKYAPATLIENVFTRNNIPYDQKVQEYINNLKNTSNAQVTSINEQIVNLQNKNQAIENKIQEVKNNIQNDFKNLDTSDSNAYYIIDSNENVIAYINEEGVHSIEFEIPGIASLSEIPQIHSQIISIQQTISNIDNSIENIDASDRDVLYIIDNANTDDPNLCNVIAMIDNEGVHSVNFHVSGSIDYITLVNKVNDNEITLNKANDNINDLNNFKTSIVETTNQLENKIQYFNGDESNTLYITDSEERVVAYIDKNGIHSINFYSKTDKGEIYNLNSTINNLDNKITQSINQEKIDRENAINSAAAALIANITTIEDKIQYFNGDEDDTIYFIDNEQNVVAYIDKDGLNIINVTITNIDSQNNIKKKNIKNNAGFLNVEGNISVTWPTKKGE